MARRFNHHRDPLLLAIIAATAACSPQARAATLEVGPGKAFFRIEKACGQARTGDTILVYPLAGNAAYEQVAVTVREKDLTFRAAPTEKGKHIRLSGLGFNYTGEGNTPRAIFQFSPGADGSVLEGFELTGAHNNSHNGAAVRIHQANHVTIRRCSIHHNDMGIMSNGDGTPATAVDQRIEFCEIHHNGDPAEPGYNHNLYLGGTSVTLSYCQIHHSLTGHNIKSRTHHTRVQYCYVHHSANRELDLVDSVDTARPDSHAVLLANIIVKDPQSKGNRGVIHFGHDGDQPRDGTLFLTFNTILTPFIAPIVDLSSPKTRANLTGNLITDGGARQNRQVMAAARDGARLGNVIGTHNWFSGSFSCDDTGLDAKTNRLNDTMANLFTNPAAHDFHLARSAPPNFASSFSIDQLTLPSVPGMPDTDAQPALKWQYRHPADREVRPPDKELTYGALAR
ncbi:MAG: right-handed parallel beta-helix repeat-containing protein [Phycisphaerae bacterium]|nr:right-handed parallel beta-helix repeat-containing protein [Phycisphaerae bacterium]